MLISDICIFSSFSNLYSQLFTTIFTRDGVILKSFEIPLKTISFVVEKTGEIWNSGLY